MRKFYYILFVIIAVILGVNVYQGYHIYNQQLSFHTDMLTNQSQICGWEIEQSGYEFENEINYIVFSTEIANFFKNQDDIELKVKKLELFYFKYQNLIKNIKIIDNNKNVYSLFKDKTNHFISDYYISQRQKTLVNREKVSPNNDGSFTYTLPVFVDNKPVVNILVKADINNYVNSVFDNYHLGSTLWQWLVSADGEIITNNLVHDTISVSNISKITDNIKNGFNGSLLHDVAFENSKNEYLSAYYPVRILTKDLGVVFSLETKTIISSIVTTSIIVGTSTTLILILIIILFIFYIRKKKKEENSIKSSLSALKEILESLPIGIMIIGDNNLVKSLNKTAINIFGLKDENELVGKNITDQFLISRKFQDSDSFSYSDNDNQYVYYDDHDNEIILYKKEIPFRIDNEDISLEAFIDITPIEKTRKREIAANKAKTEFLAKMSHEIRTPLNGIVGMANTLETLNLNAKQADAVHIIIKSADLLLSIINDILDFSKIEAGKMILEETPFKLREELEATLSLYNPQVQEKGLQLISNVHSNVPDDIIGDPFRLKQVISNLIGNAIKFTYEGKIVLSVEMLKRRSDRLTAQFSIEDTGIGIPKEKLKDIFASFSQADGSTTRKFGGTGLGITISKQLVELMGGEIWVESPSSISKDPQYSGSKFSFTIQVYSNEKSKKDVDVSKIVDYNQINVLIINNNPDEENTLYNSFNSFGTNNEQIKSTDNALTKIKESLKKPNKKYQLILIKDNANFDGIGFARKIKEKGISNNFFIGIVSSNDQPGNYVKCKMNNVDYYLIKPYEAKEVFDILKENFTKLKVAEKVLPELNKLKKNINILLAEDNIINQRVAQTIFKNLGYEISIAQNGKDCFNKVKENKYDIIFMDIMMPEKDGLEATAEIRSAGFQLPIVAMTANAREEDKTKAFDSGMNHYLSKPVRIEEIKEVLIRYFSEPSDFN